MIWWEKPSVPCRPSGEKSPFRSFLNPKPVGALLARRKIKSTPAPSEVFALQAKLQRFAAGGGR